MLWVHLKANHIDHYTGVNLVIIKRTFRQTIVDTLLLLYLLLLLLSCNIKNSKTM